MNLILDAFSDVISLQGDETMKMNIYFSPEYLNVVDSDNRKYKIVEAETSNAQGSKPFYILQLINLDNQKNQLLKINIKDMKNYTEGASIAT